MRRQPAGRPQPSARRAVERPQDVVPRQWRQVRGSKSAVDLGTTGRLRWRTAFFGIYLNDQLAVGVRWREVERWSERNNAGTELGQALARVTAIAEDVATFEQIMKRLDIPRSYRAPRCHDRLETPCRRWPSRRAL